MHVDFKNYYYLFAHYDKRTFIPHNDVTSMRNESSDFIMQNDTHNMPDSRKTGTYHTYIVSLLYKMKN